MRRGPRVVPYYFKKKGGVLYKKTEEGRHIQLGPRNTITPAFFRLQKFRLDYIYAFHRRIYKPAPFEFETVCSFNVGKDGESLYVPGTPPDWARKPLPRNAPLLPRVRDVSKQDPLLNGCHFTPMLTALQTMNPTYDLSDVDIVTTNTVLQKLMELILSNPNLTIPTDHIKLFVSKVGKTAFINLDLEKPWERTTMQEEFATPKPGWEDSYVHCRAIRYKIGELDCIVEHPVDADTSKYRPSTFEGQTGGRNFKMLFPPPNFKGRAKQVATSGRVLPPAKPGEDTRLGDSKVHFCGFGCRPDMLGSIRPLASQEDYAYYTRDTFYKEVLRRADLWFTRSPMSLNYVQSPHEEMVDGTNTKMCRFYGHRTFTMGLRFVDFEALSAVHLHMTSIMLDGLRRMATEGNGRGRCKVQWRLYKPFDLKRLLIDEGKTVEWTVPDEFQMQFWSPEALSREPELFKKAHKKGFAVNPKFKGGAAKKRKEAKKDAAKKLSVLKRNERRKLAKMERAAAKKRREVRRDAFGVY